MATAEMRSARRLARTWVSAAVSFGSGGALFVAHAATHFANADHSPAVAIHPRFLASSVGLVALSVALVGLVFHAFDVVSRDRTDRMVEALGAKPVANVELLVGQLAALVLTAWLPLCILAASLQVGPVVAGVFGRTEFGPVDALSLAAFVLIDSLPVLSAWCSVVLLLAVVLRNRLLLAIAAFALLGLYLWGLFHAPLYLLPVVSGTGGFANIASDILPRFADGPALTQRICVLVVASGLLLAAAAGYRRPDAAGRRRRLIAATAVTGAGIAGMVGLYVHVARDIGERDAWAAAHAVKRNDVRADLVKVAGRVRIDPGKRLDLDVDLTLRTPTERLAALVLSFNPGMRIEQVLLDGAAVPHEHKLGLLSVALPGSVGPDAEVVLSVRAGGVPDPRFAYLDSTVDAMRRSVADSQLHVLGTEASIFAPRYVALMPGAHWLPFPGANHEPSDASRSRRDFFEVDIEIDVPRGWLVAGPGRRRAAGGVGTATRFRFRPDAPVPAVGVFASEFERRTVDVAGVHFEILLHPGHLANFDALEDVGGIAPLVETFVPPRGQDILAYPDHSLTIVEAPGRLRSYGGGWRMDTVQSLPGIQLLREHGLPTAPLDGRIRETGGDRYGQLLFFARYFANDFGGGDPLHASRNLLPYLTGATGRSAIALDFLVEELTGRAMDGHMFRLGIDRLFSAHLYALGPPSFSVDTPLALTMANTAWIDTAAGRETERARIWSLAEDASPGDLDIRGNPRDALGLTMLGARAVAELTADVLGRERAMEFIGELRRRHAGGHFNADDILSLATDADARLGPAIADWLHGTSLAGFEASAAEVFRLTDDEQGRPRYQVEVHVHNGEPTPGWLRLYSDSPHYDLDYPGLSGPVRVGGNASVVVGVLSPTPPRAVAIIPYLSRNRGVLHVPVHRADEAAAIARDPFFGVRPSTWQPRRDDGIVVDDLDDGFGIDVATGGWRRWLASVLDDRLDYDRGLPISSAAPPDGVWFREERRWGWGRYRRTVAHIRAGDGSRDAMFAADLPSGGRWRLEYHLPEPTDADPNGRPYAEQGRYAMRLQADGEETPLEFDASVAEPGWNHLGDFALPKGQALLVVSGRTSGRSAVADAIRWRPLDESPASAP